MALLAPEPSIKKMKREAESKTTLLNDLLEEIEQSMIGDDWSVSLDAVLLCLETAPESFYRYYYRSGHSMTDLPETFQSENASILIEYLEDLGYGVAVAEFRRRGWHLTDDDYLLWEEFFLSVSLSMLASHRIDEEELEIALSGCRYTSDGLQFYCAARCSVESLLSRTLSIYAKEKALSDGAIRLLRLHTRQLFHRRLFREETIYREFYERLRETAKRRGWIGADVVPAPATLREELQLFGFEDLPGEETLKERYRVLLKEHHPDINRSSEAVVMTQKLIDAYAKICAHRRQASEVAS